VIGWLNRYGTPQSLAASLLVIRHIIGRARNRHRWPARPTTRRLR
jgi:hypothetical protein